jgi:hypothetical protein
MAIKPMITVAAVNEPVTPPRNVRRRFGLPGSGSGWAATGSGSSVARRAASAWIASNSSSLITGSSSVCASAGSWGMGLA